MLGPNRAHLAARANRRMSFDLSRLFEASLFTDRRKTAPYQTDEAELDAVRSRKKAMSLFFWPRDHLASAEFRAFANQVFERGLAIVLDRGELDLNVFVLHPDQAWRVAEVRALWQSVADWTDEAEAQLSGLLGYSKQQTRVWLADHRRREIGWTFTTVYALLTTEQRAAGLGASAADVTIFRHVDGHAMKRDAAKRVPKGLTIARVGLDTRFVHTILRCTGRIGSGIARAKAFNAALRSNVQFLGGKGWT